MHARNGSESYSWAEDKGEFESERGTEERRLTLVLAGGGHYLSQKTTFSSLVHFFVGADLNGGVGGELLLLCGDGGGAFRFGGELINDEQTISTQMHDALATVQLGRRDHFGTLIEYSLP